MGWKKIHGNFNGNGMGFFFPPYPLKWPESWMNGDTTQTREPGPQCERALLAQLAAAVTASRCWPPDSDTKSYNWKRAWGWEGGVEGEWGDGQEASWHIWSGECEATALCDTEDNAEKHNGGRPPTEQRPSGSETSARLMRVFDLRRRAHVGNIKAQNIPRPWSMRAAERCNAAPPTMPRVRRRFNGPECFSPNGGESTRSSCI